MLLLQERERNKQQEEQQQQPEVKRRRSDTHPAASDAQVTLTAAQTRRCQLHLGCNYMACQAADLNSHVILRLTTKRHLPRGLRRYSGRGRRASRLPCSRWSGARLLRTQTQSSGPQKPRRHELPSMLMTCAATSIRTVMLAEAMTLCAAERVYVMLRTSTAAVAV